MADNIADLGTEERWEMRPNWRDSNQVQLVGSRDIVAFPSTITDIFIYSPLHHNIISLKFTCENKGIEYALTDFYNNRKGRLERFWLQGYREEFILSKDISITNTIIYVEDNGFDLVYQGYERIYLELSSGDLITRKITNVAKVGTELLLTVSAMDRNILMTEVKIFGRIYLVRFNKDILNMSFKTTKISECSLEFLEVVKEYDL